MKDALRKLTIISRANVFYKYSNLNEGKVYLQPDLVDKTISTQVPKMNGGYDTQAHIIGEKQKGLLTDFEVGFNSYFVTDTPSLNKDIKQTYLTIRGSDKVSIDTLNDLGGNNVYFLYNMSKNIKLI